MFCPASPGGRLAERWRRVLEEVRRSSGGLVRATVVEQPGVPLSALLVDSSPGEQDLCEKPDCNPCITGTTKRLSCHRPSLGGMVYSCLCLTCKDRGEAEDRELVSMYHGRCNRVFYTRQGEHNKGLEKKKEENAMAKHKENFHPQEECKVSFKAEKFFKDVMSQQIFEGVSINNTPSTPGYLMNSRAEFEQGAVARVVVARGL